MHVILLVPLQLIQIRIDASFAHIHALNVSQILLVFLANKILPIYLKINAGLNVLKAFTLITTFVLNASTLAKNVKIIQPNAYLVSKELELKIDAS